MGCPVGRHRASARWCPSRSTRTNARWRCSSACGSFSSQKSLGGTESLVTYPLVQTHGSIPGPMLDKLGIDERLLLLFVGLENAEDLIADLEQAIG